MKAFIYLLVLVRSDWLTALTAGGCAFLTALSSIGLMTTAAFLIASAALHPPIMTLGVAIAGVRFFGLARAVFRYLERYFSHDVTFRLLGRIRVKLFSALEAKSPDALQKYRSGDLLSRLVADVETLKFFYLRLIIPPVTALLVLLAAALFLARYDMLFAGLLIVAFVAAGAVLPAAIRRLSLTAGREAVEARGELNSRIVDALRGAAELAALNGTESRRLAVAAAGARLEAAQERLAHLAGLSDAAAGLIAGLTLWGGLMLAVPMVQAGKFGGIELAVIVLAVQSSFEVVMPMAAAMRYFDEGLTAARRTAVFLARRQKDMPHCAEPVREESGPMDIKVAGLTFCYGSNPPALEGVSFSLPRGGRIAVAGPSGAGKSTLVSLLLKLREYSAGSIRLGGAELKTMAGEEVCRMYSYVPQESYLFNASLRENILLARPDATRDELIRAVRTARLDGVVAKLPQGLDTVVGENGFRLSGGERQRVAIARGLLKNAPVWLLDEPTAGLDNVTAAEIMNTILDVTAGRSVLLITHRLRELKAMDEIIVLDQGRVVEQGPLNVLLSRDGFFAGLWALEQDFIPEKPNV